MNQSSSKLAVTVTIYQTLIFIVGIILGFLIRTLILRFFGSDYIGLTSLYQSIFSLLSLSDLGLGITLMAILFDYIKKDDYHKLSLLLSYFRRLYFKVGTFFLLSGLTITILSDLFIPSSNIPSMESKLILLLLLSTEVFKYFFFEYKYIFLYAHQKQHITSKISFIVTLTQFTIEIFLLLIFKNFLLYLVVVISANIIKGIWISKVFNNIFKSLISIKLTQLDKLPIQEKSNINKSIKNLFILKLGARMGDSTDKIIISQLLGISMVGLYSNYLFLSGLASALLGVIRSSFQPILGKIFHSHDNESKKLIFNGIQIFNFVIVFNASFAFQSLIIPFIKLWIGDFYLLDNLVPLAMSINFFAINSIIVFLMVYEVLGLFNYGKWLNLYGAIINIILSIFLGNYFGITGILFATSISQLLTVVFYIPNLINKIILNVSSIGFIKTYLFLLFILILLFFVNQYILTITLLSHYILILFLEVIIINAILFIIFNKLPEFHWLKNYLSNFISRKKTIHN